MENRGGKREGAGRKSLGVEKRTVSFRMPVVVCARAQLLRSEGEDVTGAVVNAINELYEAVRKEGE